MLISCNCVVCVCVVLVGCYFSVHALLNVYFLPFATVTNTHVLNVWRRGEQLTNSAYHSEYKIYTLALYMTQTHTLTHIRLDITWLKTCLITIVSCVQIEFEHFSCSMEN